MREREREREGEGGRVVVAVVLFLVVTLPLTAPSTCHYSFSLVHDEGTEGGRKGRIFFFFFFFCVPQLYLWGSPLLGEIFAYVTVF